MARKGKKNTSVWKFLKFLIITGLIVFIVGVLGQRLVMFLTHADLFKIRTVAFDPSLAKMDISSNSLEKLKGKNIFKVNLWAVQKDLRYQYPSVDDLHLIRHFPDKIYVTAAHREPFALVENQGHNVIVDRGGIVVTATLLPNLKLPVITGARLNNDAAIGQPLGRREVMVALNIIRAVQTNEDLRNFPVVAIDVSNLSSIDFQLSNQMKIIIDDDKIYPKIRKLGILLAHSNVDLNDYRYIDLRFDEPVLGKNDEKTTK